MTRKKKGTYSECWSEAKRYGTVSEFRTGNLMMYYNARRKGWLQTFYWMKDDSVIRGRVKRRSEPSKQTETCNCESIDNLEDFNLKF